VTAFPARATLSVGRVAALIATLALLITACSSSTKSSSSSPASTPASTSASASAGASSTGAVAATVTTHSGSAGTFLTDGTGKSLYLFLSDTSTKSTCSGACATFWPPVVATGTLSASGGAATGKLATITRSDGSKQVTYGGHPLYTYKQDTSPGDTNGQGSSFFGAKWWLVAPSGQAITTG
jgi:predicted lipoprotein with Yx(FWY)xxD motif